MADEQRADDEGAFDEEQDAQMQAEVADEPEGESGAPDDAGAEAEVAASEGEGEVRREPDEQPDGNDAEEEDGFEEVEIEFSEDDIEAYIVDEDDNEIGFIMLDDEGNEVEYYYTDDEEPEESDEPNEDNPYDLGITREGVAEATSNMNDIYRDGIAISSELKDALTDIQEALDFSDILPGKKKKK